MIYGPNPWQRVVGRFVILIVVGPEILLQKQFRPPLDKIVIEVPAGLVDAGETAEEAAVRELKEETGYVGTASDTSPVMFNGTSAKTLRALFLKTNHLQQIPVSATQTYE